MEISASFISVLSTLQNIFLGVRVFFLEKIELYIIILHQYYFDKITHLYKIPY